MAVTHSPIQRCCCRPASRSVPKWKEHLRPALGCCSLCLGPAGAELIPELLWGTSLYLLLLQCRWASAELCAAAQPCLDGAEMQRLLCLFAHQPLRSSRLWGSASCLLPFALGSSTQLSKSCWSKALWSSGVYLQPAEILKALCRVSVVSPVAQGIRSSF